jgi:hypothetical protein
MKDNDYGKRTPLIHHERPFDMRVWLASHAEKQRFIESFFATQMSALETECPKIQRENTRVSAEKVLADYRWSLTNRISGKTVD